MGLTVSFQTANCQKCDEKFQQRYFKSVYFSRLIFKRTSGCLRINKLEKPVSIFKNTLSGRKKTLEHAYIPKYF